MSPTLRRDIECLIRSERSNVRSDYTSAEVQVYARSLIVALTGTWHFSALSLDVHLYRDVRWNQDGVEQYRELLEEVFGIALPPLQFLCARTVGDVCDRVMAALSRESRMAAGTKPAA